VNYPNLRAVIAEALQARGGKERAPQRAPVPSADGRSSFIGKSAAMREIYALIDSLAQRDVSVLITGESGTGKEMAARAIHERGVRKDGPFVALNSAAIPRDLVESELFGHTEGAFTGATRARSGCFELADGGTLFLDEITEMPIELQPKLLRVLDEATFRRVGGKREISANVRTLAATNADPRAAVRKGTLREDLYYRLNVVTLHLPPLRDRAEDIPVLATHFLDRFQRKHHAPGSAIHNETMALLARYAWPGNVRELRNIMERAVILATGEWVEPTHLPAYIRQPGSDPTEELAIPTGMTAADVERRLILQTLEATGNNKAEAARILGLNVKTIRNKIRQYEGGS
jgi:DNA-binding NtrC family response regulator